MYEFEDEKKEQEALKLLKEQTELLREIKKQNQPIVTAEDLKATLSPIDYERARHERIAQAGLGEVVQVLAKKEGYDSVDEYIENSLKRKKFENANHKSVYEQLEKYKDG